MRARRRAAAGETGRTDAHAKGRGCGQRGGRTDGHLELLQELRELVRGHGAGGHSALPVGGVKRPAQAVSWGVR